MKKKPREMGALESPIDYRQDIASIFGIAPTSVAFKLPETFDTKLGPVMDQNKEPACVSFSIVECLKQWWFEKTGEWVDFSPRFLDILVKRYDGQERSHAGTYPSMVMKLVSQYGCATTKTLPNDTTLSVLEYRDDSLLTDEVFKEAEKYKIPGYVKIPVDFQNLRQATYYYNAISILFRIGDTLWTPSWSAKDTDPLRTPVTISGGHQMTGKGWVDGIYNVLRNEWSDLWGNKGEVRYDAKAWLPFIVEAWAIADLPEDLVNYLKMLPKASEFHYAWTSNLKRGDNNEDVKFAQIAFMILGYLQPIPPNELGIYGPKTSKAVLAYQKSKGIKKTAPDNIGPQTRAFLNKEFAI
jgi:hypothetical protein